MIEERVLALDVSTKTGYSVAIINNSGIKLWDYGQIPAIHEPEDFNYPSSYIIWAYQCFNSILDIIKKYEPQVLVIEETSKGSKNAMSQKILEFTHFLLAQYIKDSKIKSTYIQSEQWRREIGCKMSDTEKARNKEVRAYKKKNRSKRAYDINGKLIGIVGRKHVNIRRANEIFSNQLKEPLRKKDEDLADSLGLLGCYYYRQLKPSDTEEMTLEDIIKDDNE